MILDRIKESVCDAPLQTAVHSQEGDITYKELWDSSDSLAAYMSGNIKNHFPVIVYGHKAPLMITAFLACAKSGRAYCPVDTSMSGERIADIVNTVGEAVVIITADEYDEKIWPENAHIIDKKTTEKICAAGDTVPESEWLGGGEVFYIIFTSGSTGKPKGVQITNSNLSAFAEWSSDLGGPRAEKRYGTYINQAPFSFDLSVMDLYTSLTNCCRLWCIGKSLQSDHEALLQYIKQGCPDFWVSTPSFANLCLADHEFSDALMPDMKVFYFCGETLNKDTAARLRERFPRAAVVNTYGPTESTCAVTGTVITAEMLKDPRPLPIGTVKPGTEIAICNNEIIISGDRLSPGYLNDPQKTKAAFFTADGGMRSYHTGDAGYFDGDMLYYEGRIDMQIKYHGYRIELSDIESNLMALDGVLEAAVVPDCREDRIRNIAAFIISGKYGDVFEDRQEIRKGLRNRLPVYMVPKIIKFTDAFPMTGNGKIDRKALQKIIQEVD